MSLSPRPYQGAADLQKMCALLQSGRAAQNGTYYVHVGDLLWWLYYPPFGYEPWQNIYLWDDPAAPERLLSWALFSPRWCAFDVYVQPELRGTPQAMAMYTWAEETQDAAVRSRGKNRLDVMWVSKNDKILNEHFRQRGFQRTPDDTVYMVCPLDGSPTQAALPEGYTVRSCRGESEVRARARAQYGAFESDHPFDEYVERFRRFMRSPAYTPALDIVAANAAGQIGAFCIAWLDEQNKVGLIEPVGTHPDFQRKGLGKAVMLEALRRLQEHGMETAIVCTEAENHPAVKLYEALGFQTTDCLGLYRKML